MSRHARILALLTTVALGAAVLPSGSASSAPHDNPMFRSMSGFRPTGSHAVKPRDYRAFRVDTAKVRADLSSAPRVGADGAETFSIPTPTGGTERFAVQRTTVMEPRLAAAHPEIQTWVGHSLDKRGTTVALDVTPLGFHASVLGPNGQNAWYVDPAYDKRGTSTHLSYYGSDLARPEKQFVEREGPEVARAMARRAARTGPGAAVVQRVYRLALLSDPTYAEYWGPANVLAAKATLMNRVNQLYNEDLAIKMVLVDGSDRLSLDTDAEATAPDGPCGAHPCFTNDPDSPDYVEGQIAYCDVGTLVRNQVVIGQLLPGGASDYDIGHLALGTNGGGIAGLGVVGSIEKAQGCTGIPTPQGDFYAVDYVAHEMGHEFGGNHTFNGTQSNCADGNRNGPTSVEPGSGSSVMAYAGICRQDNLQPHSDPYFSQRSIDEIGAYTSGVAAAPVEVQDVSLEGFDPGDSITIDYPGSTAAPVTLTLGGTGASAYNAADIERAVESLTGKNVTIAKWGYDPYVGYNFSGADYPAPAGSPDASGFEVVFDDDLDPYDTPGESNGNEVPNGPPQDEASLQVTSTNVGYIHVGETAKGGDQANRGDQVIRSKDNHNPVVTAPADKTLPMRTPFTLTGRGTDPDHDALTYLWEQNDVGGVDGTALVSNAKHDGPLFRVFGTYADVSDEDDLQSPAPGENRATGSPRRTFPDMAQILAGDTNANTGRCPKAPPDTVPPAPYVPVPIRILNCYSEFLPVKGYVGRPGSKQPAMHFRLTARDMVPLAGGVAHDDVTLRLDPHAGPFLVRSYRSGGSVRGGSKTTIRWAVNGTHRLASRVRILLSTDNGTTWSRVLARRTANDGRARVTIPRSRTSTARIMIRALGNYFFDVNDHTFRIR